MSLQRIVQLRSPTDRNLDSILRHPCVRVEVVTAEILSLIDDLRDTLAAHRVAVGLAAPQLGRTVQVAVVDLKTPGGPAPLVLINPEVVSTSGKKDLKKESCMSVPGVRGAVVRREKLRINFQDQSGSSRELEADGFYA